MSSADLVRRRRPAPPSAGERDLGCARRCRVRRRRVGQGVAWRRPLPARFDRDHGLVERQARPQPREREHRRRRFDPDAAEAVALDAVPPVRRAPLPAVHVSMMLYGPSRSAGDSSAPRGLPRAAAAAAGAVAPASSRRAPDEDEREHEHDRGKDDASNRHGSPPKRGGIGVPLLRLLRTPRRMDCP